MKSASQNDLNLIMMNVFFVSKLAFFLKALKTFWIQTVNQNFSSFYMKLYIIYASSVLIRSIALGCTFLLC